MFRYDEIANFEDSVKKFEGFDSYEENLSLPCFSSLLLPYLRRFHQELGAKRILWRLICRHCQIFLVATWTNTSGPGLAQSHMPPSPQLSCCPPRNSWWSLRKRNLWHSHIWKFRRSTVYPCFFRWCERDWFRLDTIPSNRKREDLKVLNRSWYLTTNDHW